MRISIARRFRISLPAVLLFCSAGVVESSGQGIVNEIFSLMDTHQKALMTLESDVVRVKVNSQLGGVTDTQTGRLIYAAKGRKNPMMLRVDFNKPDESFGIRNEEYVVFRPVPNQAWTGSTRNVKAGTGQANLFAFFRMTRPELSNTFSARYLGRATVKSGKNGTDTMHLELTPKAPANYRTAEIWVDGNGLPVQVKINEKCGDSTTLLLTNIEPRNGTINASKFEIKLNSKTAIHGER